MVTIAKGNFSAGSKKPDSVRVPPTSKNAKKKKSFKIVLLVFFSMILVLMLGAVGYLGYFGFTPDDRLIYESADLIYHLIVLLTSKGYRIEDLARELKERHSSTWKRH